MKNNILRIIGCMALILSMFLGMTGCSAPAGAGTASATSAAASSAASSGSGSATATAPSKALTLGITDWPGMYTYYGIDQTGIFKANGVNVDIRYFAKYNDLIAAFNSGNLDMASLSYCDTIPAMLSGLDYRFVLVSDTTYGADGLIAKSDIKSVTDLKGKKVATEYGTSDHYFLLRILQKYGMTEKDIQYVNLTLSDASAALMTGQVDAVVTLEPYLSKLKDSGFNLLFDSSQMYGIVPTTLVVKNDVITAQRDAVTAVIKSWFDGVKKVQSQDGPFLDAVAKKSGITKEDYLNYMKIIQLYDLDKNVEAFSDGQNYINVGYGCTQSAQFMYDCGLIKQVPKDISHYIDSSFIDELGKKAK